jgi:hypothetical protein
MQPMEVGAKEEVAEWHLEAAVVEVADLTTTGRHFLTNKAVLRVLRDHERVPDH